MKRLGKDLDKVLVYEYTALANEVNRLDDYRDAHAYIGLATEKETPL